MKKSIKDKKIIIISMILLAVVILCFLIWNYSTKRIFFGPNTITTAFNELDYPINVSSATFNVETGRIEGERLIPPYYNPAIFFSPHPDDESIGMAGSIKEHVYTDRQVFLELINGILPTQQVDVNSVVKKINCRICNHFFGNSCSSIYANQYTGTGIYSNVSYTDCHANGTTTENYITPAEAQNYRIMEFLAAAKKLGVDGIYISYPLENSNSIRQTTLKRVNFWKNVPKRGWLFSIKSPLGSSEGEDIAKCETHSQHNMVWEVLKQNKLDYDLRGYYIYYFSQKTTADCMLRSSTLVKHLSRNQCRAKLSALNEYGVWDPSNRRYAYGNTSVPELILASSNECIEYILRN